MKVTGFLASGGCDGGGSCSSRCSRLVLTAVAVCLENKRKVSNWAGTVARKHLR